MVYSQRTYSIFISPKLDEYVYIEYRVYSNPVIRLYLEKSSKNRDHV